MTIFIDDKNYLVHVPDATRIAKRLIPEQKFSNPILSFKKNINQAKQISIGDFKQGYLNDCWLCAIAKSLSFTNLGRGQLGEMIQNNYDGTYMVTFANGMKFNIKEDELNDPYVKSANGENMTDGQLIVYVQDQFPYIGSRLNPAITYSKGCKNLKLLEIAANKYVHYLVDKDIKSGIISKQDRNKYCLHNYILNPKDIFGEISDYPTYTLDLNFLEASDILMVATYSDSALNSLKNKGISNHAYCVKSMDKSNKKIYLINPHNTEEEPLCLTFNEFYERFGVITLKGSYKDNFLKSNIAQNINEPEYIRKIMDIAEKQAMNEIIAITYAKAIPDMYKEMGDRNTQARVIAQLIEYSSKGIGTRENAFKGALYSIDSKETLEIVNKYLSELQNAEYKTTSSNALQKYIEEEFSFSDKNKLLNYINKLK